MRNRCAESKASLASSNWLLERNLSPMDRHTDKERRSSYKRFWLSWWVEGDGSAIDAWAATWLDMVVVAVVVVVGFCKRSCVILLVLKVFSNI